MNLRLGRCWKEIVGKKKTEVMEKNMTYEEAVAELQQLVAVIEAPDAQIAGVAKELKRAMELLEFCRKELDGYENDFNKILNKEQL